MKKILYLAVTAALLTLAWSCSSGTTPKASQAVFVDNLTSTDSTEMLKLCENCMELLKQRNLEGALSMIYEYDDSTQAVYALKPETRTRLMRLFTIFPVLSYQNTEVTFMEQGRNNVKYEVVFAVEDDPERNGIPKTAYMFNPVKVDGNWYLTMKRADQKEGLAHPEIEDNEQIDINEE